MTTDTQTRVGKKVSTILVSQPKPERSPYYKIEDKYKIQIDWRKFIQVEPVTEKEFRKSRLKPDEYDAVIFTSRNSITHFFRLVEEMRMQMSAETRYFCLSENIANYLQKFITYRKRKVFYGEKYIQDLESVFDKYKNLSFILPCSNLGAQPVQEFLDRKKIKYDEAMMYKTVSSDLSDLRDIFYDVLIFFSPLGIESLYENFPDFEQNDTRIATFGTATAQAAKERGLIVDIEAPNPENPSMSMALENYISSVNTDN